MWYVAGKGKAVSLAEQEHILTQMKLKQSALHVPRFFAVERIVVYLVGEAATAEKYRTGRQAVFDMWQELNEEDIGLLESLQKGRAAPGYDGGMLSPYWDEAPRNFARLVVRTILEESQRPASPAVSPR